MIEEICTREGRKQHDVYDINFISLRFHVRVVTWNSVVRRVRYRCYFRGSTQPEAQYAITDIVVFVACCYGGTAELLSILTNVMDPFSNDGLNFRKCYLYICVYTFRQRAFLDQNFFVKKLTNILPYLKRRIFFLFLNPLPNISSTIYKYNSINKTLFLAFKIKIL